MRQLLVTNDFPPKIGGIQSYLWELWRRLPSQDVTVLTTPYPGDADFDAGQDFRVVRTRQRWLLPTRSLIRQINKLAHEVDAELIVLDPILPLGLVGPKLEKPYVPIGHGAELTIPGRIPVTGNLAATVLKWSSAAVAGGAFVEQHIGRLAPSLRIVSIPPGVDTTRFRPLSDDERGEVREHYGIDPDTPLIVGVSRLVPRKGFDRLVIAASRLQRDWPGLRVLIVGKGRDEARLQRLIERHNAPVSMLGRVDDASLPGIYGAADIFCMPCHDRWLGLEQEGFGIVFAEASATGVAVVAGSSGGSAEAVLDGKTGLVLPPELSAKSTFKKYPKNHPKNAGEDPLVQALGELLSDPSLRQRLGAAGRDRACAELSYDALADRLLGFLSTVVAK